MRICITVHISPELTFAHYLFSFRKGSEAALIWHVTERRGSIERARQSKPDHGGAPRGAHRERWADANPQKPVRVQGCPFGPRLQLPAVPFVCVVTRLTVACKTGFTPMNGTSQDSPPPHPESV